MEKNTSGAWPPGRYTHVTPSRSITIVTLALALALLAAGCMVGLVVTPDLDVRHRDTHSETIVRRTWGRVIGALWDLLWLPYAYIIPRHRHPLSHGR